MAVVTGAEETHEVARALIRRGQRRQLGGHFGFRQSGRELDRGTLAQMGRDVRDQVLDAGSADRFEHRADLAFGMWNESHRASPV